MGRRLATGWKRGLAGCAGIVAAGGLACGSEEPRSAPTPPPAEPAVVEEPPAPAEPDELPYGLVLSLAQFIEVAGKPEPGPGRLEFLYRHKGDWRVTAVEDPDSNVFHKAMAYGEGEDLRLLTMAGTKALVKTWAREGSALEPTTHWEKDFGGKFSRMRDAEIADLYADGEQSIAVATHDQGVVAVLRPSPDGFSVVELDEEADTFVHEIEVGDLNGDGQIEVYATPSEPNRLEGGEAQKGFVVRYVPVAGEKRVVVADLGDRHAKEILVEDVDGDGTDELYVSVEGHVGELKELVHPVEIRRYDADTPADAGIVIATLKDRLTRFLTAGDVDGDGQKEMVAATFSAGLWLLKPGSDPRAEWTSTLIDKDSAGFEHASILADLDQDGRDELYVASDRHKEVRRYVWKDGKFERTVIYERPDNRPIFTWNLMPVPTALIPGA